MANASALFQIDPGTLVYGTAGVAQNAAAGATVNCRIASTVGVDSIAWRIFGTSGTATPAITLSGSPTGQIASFALPAGVGQAYGIECKVNGGTGTDFGDTKTSAVYVLDANGRRPFFIGETYEADATYGVVPRLNTAVAAISSTSSYIPQWTKYTKTYSDLSAAANTNSITLLTLPIKGVIHGIAIKHSAAFTGGAIASYAVAVGISGDTTKFATWFNVFQAPGNQVGQASNVGVGIENFGATTTVLLSATSVGGLLNAATAGSVDVWVLSSTLT